MFPLKALAVAGSIAVDEHGIVADVAAAASRAAGSVGAIPVTS